MEFGSGLFLPGDFFFEPGKGDKLRRLQFLKLFESIQQLIATDIRKSNIENDDVRRKLTGDFYGCATIESRPNLVAGHLQQDRCRLTGHLMVVD